MQDILNMEWWQAGLLVLGLAAIVSVLASIFIKSETLTEEFFGSVPPIGSEDFFNAASGMINSPVSTGGSIELLNNGSEFLPTLLSDMSKASSSINITNYIWKDGEMSDSIFSVLISKAKEGVEVRILLDTLGGKMAPLDKIRELREAGGRVKYFRTPKFGRLSRFHKRNHRRSFVVDGVTGYTGGIAIDDKWSGNPDGKNKWRDTMVRVTGPPAHHIQSVFVQLWTSTTGEVLSGKKFFPSVESEGNLVSMSILSSPAEDTQPLPYFVWLSISAAQKSIYITNPYFLPPKTILEALKNAAEKGVDVKILLPSRLTDAKHVRLAGHTNYEELLKSGVRIYEYENSRLHSKNIVIDGKWSIVGSANLDNRSFVLNQENVLAVFDEEFGRKMEETFKKDLENSKEIKYEEWKRRNYFLRFLEILSKGLEKQY